MPRRIVASAAESDVIAFVSERELGNQIWLMNDDGTAQHRLTIGRDNSQPTWSPDGARIAYVCHLPEGLPDDLCIANSDGSAETRISTTWREMTVSWSPDGNQLAFSSDRLGSSDLFVLEVSNPANVQLLFSSPGSDFSPRWSPDGAHVAFTSNMEAGTGGNYDIYVIDVATRALQRITSHPAQDVTPTWSPDGTRIGFASHRPSDGGGDVFVADAGATESNVVRLTDLPGNAANPAWSPDGQWMAIIWNLGEGGPYEVFKVSITNPALLVNLTQNAANDEQPAWRPRALANPHDPSSKDQCKNGGWADYGFKNQGQCVRFVETGRDSR